MSCHIPVPPREVKYAILSIPESGEERITNLVCKLKDNEPVLRVKTEEAK